MAHLHQFHKNQSPGLFASIGNKIKSVAEVAGAIKSIYEIGKGILAKELLLLLDQQQRQ